MVVDIKKIWKKNKKKLNDYKTLQNLKLGNLGLYKEFPHCFVNRNLKEAVYVIMFSLQNEKIQ